MKYMVENWTWILAAVVIVVLVTGVWNEIAGVPHVR